MRSAGFLTVAAAAWLASGIGVVAQDAPPQPPPPPPKQERPLPAGPDGAPRPENDRERHRGGPGPGGMPGSRSGGFSGGFSRGDRDRDRGGDDMFKGLPEAERQRVRQAFEKAWQDPEVNAARDRLSKANEDFRLALHNALKKVDPEVVKILDRVRPPGGFPGGPRMPDVNDPEFADKAVVRLSGELQMWHRMDRRDSNSQPMHDRVMGATPVREALERLKSAPAEQRPEAWKQLREAYLSEAKSEFSKAFGRLPWERNRDRDGSRPPGGPGPGPGERGDRPPPPPPPAGDGKDAPAPPQI